MKDQGAEDEGRYPASHLRDLPLHR
jgi:hypothetical protein